MSSDSSDSEGLAPEGGKPDYDSDSQHRPSNVIPGDESKGPRTPGSPVSEGSPSGSPAGTRSPSGPRSPSQQPSPQSGRAPRSPSPQSPQSRGAPRSPSPQSPQSRGAPRSPSPQSPQSRGAPRSPSPQSRSPAPSPRSRPVPRSPSPQSRSPSRSRSRTPSRRSPPLERRPRSPPDNLDDDGRSNISSGSSILSQVSNKEQRNGELIKTNASPAKKNFSVPNAEDLSDVSDIDDSDGLADDSKSAKSEEPPMRPLARRSPDKMRSALGRDAAEARRDRFERDNRERIERENRDRAEREKRDRAEREKREREKRDKRESIHMDDGEQLDFETEDQPEVEREDGECETAAVSEKKDKPRVEREEGEEKSGDEGELKEEGAESLEEGEVSDEGDPKPEKPPICRFYSRGACTWGSNCRFLHPGVTDKGNYSMFEVTRPMVAPPNGLGMYLPEPRPYPLMVPPARAMAGGYGSGVRREDPAAVESAWERGLRQAKEMMRKSTKRKETDMDFEEKKMNLSIGQDEMDKENDYYTRAASPMDDPDQWASRISPKMDPEQRRPAVRVVERYEDIIPEPMSPAVYDRYDYRRPYDKPRDPEYMLRREKKYYTEEEMLARKGKKMVREVIVQRVERSERPERGKRPPSEAGRRPDEWSDPWMRSKSPGGRKGHPGQPHRSRKVSYSSGSSSYSGSSSRSSSNSSFTSYSRSRSGSRSGSGSPSPSRPRRPRSPPALLAGRAKLLDAKFKPLKAGAAPEKGVGERPLLMNPPAPSPRRAKERPLSPSAMRKVGLNPPAPTPKARTSQKHGGKARARKSRSSSSGSSGSSSESTHSSLSSSSGSSRAQSPSNKARAGKKAEPDERLAAAALKGKGLDALKSAGQKPQIKLTIKPTEGKRDKNALPLAAAGKKRPAEDPPAADAREPSPGKAGGKKASSRREELLKQLKAVEDAIARKRSKI